MEAWKATTDPSTGRTYYYNKKTKETRWTLPTSQAAETGVLAVSTPAVATNSPKSQPNKPAWKEAHDPSNGRRYWYNRETRETRWTRPAEAPPAAASADVSKAVRIYLKTDGASMSPTFAAPSLPVPPSQDVSISEAMSSSVWRKAEDPSTGRAYFFNKKTKETRWQAPPSDAAHSTSAEEYAKPPRPPVADDAGGVSTVPAAHSASIQSGAHAGRVRVPPAVTSSNSHAVPAVRGRRRSADVREEQGSAQQANASSAAPAAHRKAVSLLSGTGRRGSAARRGSQGGPVVESAAADLDPRPSAGTTQQRRILSPQESPTGPGVTSVVLTPSKWVPALTPAALVARRSSQSGERLIHATAAPVAATVAATATALLPPALPPVPAPVTPGYSGLRGLVGLAHVPVVTVDGHVAAPAHLSGGPTSSSPQAPAHALPPAPEPLLYKPLSTPGQALSPTRLQQVAAALSPVRAVDHDQEQPHPDVVAAHPHDPLPLPLPLSRHEYGSATTSGQNSGTSSVYYSGPSTRNSSGLSTPVPVAVLEPPLATRRLASYTAAPLPLPPPAPQYYDVPAERGAVRGPGGGQSWLSPAHQPPLVVLSPPSSATPTAASSFSSSGMLLPAPSAVAPVRSTRSLGLYRARGQRVSPLASDRSLSTSSYAASSSSHVIWGAAPSGLLRDPAPASTLQPSTLQPASAKRPDLHALLLAHRAEWQRLRPSAMRLSPARATAEGGEEVAAGGDHAAAPAEEEKEEEGLLPLELPGAALSPTSKPLQLAGVLYKKSRSGWRGWRSRFFLTHRWLLLYYGSENDAAEEPLGVIDLRQLTDLRVAEEIGAHRRVSLSPADRSKEDGDGDGSRHRHSLRSESTRLPQQKPRLNVARGSSSSSKLLQPDGVPDVIRNPVSERRTLAAAAAGPTSGAEAAAGGERNPRADRSAGWKGWFASKAGSASPGGDSSKSRCMLELQGDEIGVVALRAPTPDNAVCWHSGLLAICAQYGARAAPRSCLASRLADGLADAAVDAERDGRASGEPTPAMTPRRYPHHVTSIPISNWPAPESVTHAAAAAYSAFHAFPEPQPVRRASLRNLMPPSIAQSSVTSAASARRDSTWTRKPPATRRYRQRSASPHVFSMTAALGQRQRGSRRHSTGDDAVATAWLQEARAQVQLAAEDAATEASGAGGGAQAQGGGVAQLPLRERGDVDALGRRAPRLPVSPPLRPQQRARPGTVKWLPYNLRSVPRKKSSASSSLAPPQQLQSPQSGVAVVSNAMREPAGPDMPVSAAGASSNCADASVNLAASSFSSALDASGGAPAVISAPVNEVPPPVAVQTAPAASQLDSIDLSKKYANTVAAQSQESVAEVARAGITTAPEFNLAAARPAADSPLLVLHPPPAVPAQVNAPWQLHAEAAKAQAVQRGREISSFLDSQLRAAKDRSRTATIEAADPEKPLGAAASTLPWSASAPLLAIARDAVQPDAPASPVPSVSVDLSAYFPLIVSVGNESNTSQSVLDCAGNQAQVFAVSFPESGPVSAVSTPASSSSPQGRSRPEDSPGFSLSDASLPATPASDQKRVAVFESSTTPVAMSSALPSPAPLEKAGNVGLLHAGLRLLTTLRPSASAATAVGLPLSGAGLAALRVTVATEALQLHADIARLLVGPSKVTTAGSAASIAPAVVAPIGELIAVIRASPGVVLSLAEAVGSDPDSANYLAAFGRFLAVSVAGTFSVSPMVMWQLLNFSAGGCALAHNAERRLLWKAEERPSPLLRAIVAALPLWFGLSVCHFVSRAAGAPASEVGAVVLKGALSPLTSLASSVLPVLLQTGLPPASVATAALRSLLKDMLSPRGVRAIAWPAAAAVHLVQASLGGRTGAWALTEGVLLPLLHAAARNAGVGADVLVALGLEVRAAANGSGRQSADASIGEEDISVDTAALLHVVTASWALLGAKVGSAIYSNRLVKKGSFPDRILLFHPDQGEVATARVREASHVVAAGYGSAANALGVSRGKAVVANLKHLEENIFLISEALVAALGQGDSAALLPPPEQASLAVVAISDVAVVQALMAKQAAASALPLKLAAVAAALPPVENHLPFAETYCSIPVPLNSSTPFVQAVEPVAPAVVDALRSEMVRLQALAADAGMATLQVASRGNAANDKAAIASAAHTLTTALQLQLVSAAAAVTSSAETLARAVMEEDTLVEASVLLRASTSNVAAVGKQLFIPGCDVVPIANFGEEKVVAVPTIDAAGPHWPAGSAVGALAPTESVQYPPFWGAAVNAHANILHAAEKNLVYDLIPSVEASLFSPIPTVSAVLLSSFGNTPPAHSETFDPASGGGELPVEYGTLFSPGTAHALSSGEKSRQQQHGALSSGSPRSVRFANCGNDVPLGSSTAPPSAGFLSPVPQFSSPVVAAANLDKAPLASPRLLDFRQPGFDGLLRALAPPQLASPTQVPVVRYTYSLSSTPVSVPVTTISLSLPSLGSTAVASTTTALASSAPQRSAPASATSTRSLQSLMRGVFGPEAALRLGQQRAQR